MYNFLSVYLVSQQGYRPLTNAVSMETWGLSKLIGILVVLGEDQFMSNLAVPTTLLGGFACIRICRNGLSQKSTIYGKLPEEF